MFSIFDIFPPFSIGKKNCEINDLSEFSTFSFIHTNKEFRILDKDHSGELDPTEFAALFKTRMKGSTPEQIQALFRVFDTDGSGTISFKELATALSIISKGDNKDKLTFLFRSFDLDNSKTLTKDELSLLVKINGFCLCSTWTQS